MDPQAAAVAAQSNWVSAVTPLLKLLCLTVIGIPLGIGSFKMVPLSLLPLGREIVDSRTADAWRRTAV